MPRTRTGTHTLCASLRSRNKLVSFTRAIFTEMYRGNAAPKNRDTHFLRACAVEMHLKISQEPLQKIPRPSWSILTGHAHFAEPSKSKCTEKFPKSHVIRKFPGKMPRPKPGHTHTLCASLPCRNALGDFTRATLYRNVQENIRTQLGHLIKHSPLPSVWTQCSGKKRPYPHHTIPQLWETGTASRKQPSSRFTRLGWHINIKLPDDKSTKHSKATKCLQKSRGILR